MQCKLQQKTSKEILSYVTASSKKKNLKHSTMKINFLMITFRINTMNLKNMKQLTTLICTKKHRIINWIILINIKNYMLMMINNFPKVKRQVNQNHNTQQVISLMTKFKNLVGLDKIWKNKIHKCRKFLKLRLFKMIISMIQSLANHLQIQLK